MKVQILDTAEQDLIDGYLFYERQGDGLGRYFRDTLFFEIDSLALYAGIHPKFYGYHRLLSKRFPYAVYYTTVGEVVLVHAVLDCRRDPSWIDNRLT